MKPTPMPPMSAGDVERVLPETATANVTQSPTGIGGADGHLPLGAPAPGELLTGTAVLRVRTPGVASNGKEFLSIELANSLGSIGSRVWSERLPAWADVAVGDAVSVVGVVKPGFRNGPPELDVRQVVRLPEDHPVRMELNPICPVPLAVLLARFEALQAPLRPGARALLDAVLTQAGRNAWWTCPAAKTFHDAHLHGLASHSITVAELAILIAQGAGVANFVWLDALIVSSLLHDVAKVVEYEWDGVPIDMARSFYLTSHLVAGARLVEAAVAAHRPALEAAGTTDAEIRVLLHVIESHHGEHGSPTQPSTLEATIIHLADLAAARLSPMGEQLARLTPDEEGWIDPSGYRARPVWVPSATVIRDVSGGATSASVMGQVGSSAVAAAARAVIAGGPSATADARIVRLPTLTPTEAAGFVATLWQAAATWDQATRRRRAALLRIAEGVLSDLPERWQQRLLADRPNTADAA